jgi:WxL interacting protein linking bacterial and host surfaces
MIRHRILTAFVVVLVAVSGIVGVAWRGGRAYAAQTAIVGGNAMKVSPVRSDLTMDPGTSKTIPMFVTNLTSVPTTLHAAVNDFVASNDESGKPSIILDENQYAPSHSLKQFIAPVKNFTLAPNATLTINIVVTVPKGAAGGGYFGAVRFEPAGAGANKSLNLSASVGSLILLRVNGDIREQMNVASLEVRKDDKPSSFFTGAKQLTGVVRFQNTGNVQVEPFGKLLIKRFGKTVATYEVNNKDPRGSVLPDSVRRFNVPLDKVTSFGKYTVDGNFGYGSTGQLLSASATFYVVPVFLLILIGLAVVGLLLLIFVVPRMLRAYNRRVVRRASRRR